MLLRHLRVSFGHGAPLAVRNSLFQQTLAYSEMEVMAFIDIRGIERAREMR